MIEKFTFGNPVETSAVVQQMDSAGKGAVMQFGTVQNNWPFEWTYQMDTQDMVFGLGEAMQGINKRGSIYEMWCSDVPNQSEFTKSMYGAHSFIMLYNASKYNSICFGVFFDTSSLITFDIGNTDSSILRVKTEDTGVNVYVITPSPDRLDSQPSDVIRQFHHLIGQNYIPPKWAFGFQQSRWGYKTEDDVRTVAENYRKNNLPLDAICLDIDYMEDYKDFTVNKERFPDMQKLCSDLKKDGIRLIPIIDAGIKAQDGFDVFEEGKNGGFLCTKEDGSVFTAGVWPGLSAFPDFTNKKARAWFGSYYKRLTDLGIEGFWNDMNEPALFYTKEGLQKAFDKFHELESKELDVDSFFEFTPISTSTSNSMDDYKSFYNTVPETENRNEEKVEKIRHDKVHNLYGANMVRAASEAFDSISPDKRLLLYARASHTASHRWGGIWTGDNQSTWSHLEQEIKMLPSLNMAGFLYSGADIGGFGGDATRELVLRWLALGVFTPLMRNHCAWNGRNQECYAFENTEDFKSILDFRYALIPYLYSEFIKASVSGGMLIRPIGFDFADDIHALATEDQLMVGEGIMIAPVYKPNAASRYVYLPETMTKVTWCNGRISTEEKQKGSYYINVPLNTVIFFVRKGMAVPLVRPAKDTSSIDSTKYAMVGSGNSYRLYEDDGFTKSIDIVRGIRTISKQ